MHKLEIIDLSADFSDTETLLFNTTEGATGYAARKGSFHGYRQFKLDGRQIRPAEEEAAKAEEPCGYVRFGITYMDTKAA